MSTRLFIGLSLILVLCSLTYAESENYCHDEKSWAKWDRIIEKNHNDMEVQALHALRIGLCEKGRGCVLVRLRVYDGAILTGRLVLLDYPLHTPKKILKETYR